MYIKLIKPLLDKALALVLLVILLPLLIVVALLVRLFIGAPIIFKQERIGLNDKKFLIYKFRTLVVDNGNISLAEEAIHTNLFGRLLRRTSLDELPQLINILKGEMSFVGPRPIIETDYYSCKVDGHECRHVVRPGLTGWAQINGRNNISWSEKFNHDLWYIKHVSFWLDMKIMALTFFKHWE